VIKKFEGFTVDGKPFFPLGAQAHNSGSYSRKMFEESCRAAKALRCNTVEAPLYWEKVESREGGFDFSALDYMLELCRASDLRLVILWFGSWKNGDMSYAPEWVKRDGDRFQRVLRSDGVAVSDLSAHYRENREADARAFAALCARLKTADSGKGTVIAVQEENEPGYLRTDRDYSPRALEDQAAPVPEALLDYLEAHCGAAAHGDWKKNGGKRGFPWAETFGFHGYEYCEAWTLARYIDAVAGAGKEQYRIPMYVNV
jgi:beta-galactosidase GanA